MNFYHIFEENAAVSVESTGSGGVEQVERTDSISNDTTY